MTHSTPKDKFIKPQFSFYNYTKNQVVRIIDHPRFKLIVVRKELGRKTFDGEVWSYPMTKVNDRKK